MLSILAPARTALWIAIGCQRASHLASADMVASSASSSYAVRSLMGQAVRSAHSSASWKGADILRRVERDGLLRGFGALVRRDHDGVLTSCWSRGQPQKGASQDRILSV